MPLVTKQKATIQKSNPSTKSSSSDDAWDLASHVKMLLYGRSGTGKTTLWSGFPDPILALICSGGNNPGELRSIDTPENRKRIKAKVVRSVESFKDLIADAGNFATVVLDHASGLQDLTLKEILGLDELPAQKSWGLATQQQYGQSTLMCKELFRALLNLPAHVVIVAQERTFGEENSGDLIQPTVGAALTPSLTGWLGPACDFVVQTYLRPKMVEQRIKIAGKETVQTKRGKGIAYCLRTEPHEVYMTKFRVPKGRKVPECIEDPTYEKIRNLINGGSL